MTGVSIDTLRAWERRYSAVSPGRDARGRVYADADIRRISLLRDAVGNGHAIGRVAGLPDDQLATVAGASARVPARSATALARSPVPSGQIDAIIGALERFDTVAVETELARAAALLRAPDLLREVLVPVLTEVGERWHGGRGRIAHEHLLSASVRNVLGSLLRVHQRSGVRDRLLFATPSGERHEFGTLGAAMLAASGGLGTLYLGPDMPADEVLAVTTVTELDVVVLGVTNVGDMAHTDQEMDVVAERLDARLELWVGGPGAERMAKRLKGRALPLPTYDLLERQLVRLGARF